MALLAGDIRFARSVNMSDVPEGGGPPSAQLLNSGRSNEVFPDISEETRTVGRVEIYQIFSVLRNSDSTPLLGGNVILAEPPADPNVSITMLSLKNPFATRADIASRIESGMSPGSEWNGYLLENHFTTMRSLTLLQRPGVTPPVVGRTYLLIYNEGQPSERRQRVRIKSTDTIQRIFTEVTDKGNVDFLAQVSTCEIFDGLSHDFPGSPPISTFARSSTKSLIRETVYSDSGMFYSATPLAQATAINDVWLKVASIYTQVVPNSRTEVVAIDQYPAARRTLVLAESPRRVEVGITPHTQRIRIAEENAGTIYVALLKPLPAAGTVFVDFWALGQRYTLSDDGTGRMVGQGSGSVNYLTGALQLTLKSLPDIGSSITISHGESMAYTNRSGQAGYRAPEFAWGTPQYPLEPGSVVVTWRSGSATKAVTDNGTGGLTGDASGEINYASGLILLRPTAMIDAGGEFVTDYKYSSVRTENITNASVDAGGFAALTLQEVPAPRSIKIEWITVRNVSESAGTSDFVSKNESGTESIYETKTQTVYEPDPPKPPVQPQWGTVVVPSSSVWTQPPGTLYEAQEPGWLRVAPGQKVPMRVYTDAATGNGAFRWVLVHVSGGSLASAFPVLSGTVQVAESHGFFDIATLSDMPADVSYHVRIEQVSGGALVAMTTQVQVIDKQEPVPADDMGYYTTYQIDGFYGLQIPPGQARYASFKGPVSAGSYRWELDANFPEDFEATQGTFPVSKGEGAFQVTPKATLHANSSFTVKVLKQDGTVLAKTGLVFVAMAYTPTEPPPPPATVKVRDPISTNTTVTGGSTAVHGMFAGGVDGSGKAVYVAVPPSISEKWGAFYDPPASESELWTQAQLSVKFKPMQSVNGNQTTYYLWGAQ